MAVPLILTSFAAGEMAPGLFGRTDIAKYHVGLSTCRNMYVGYKGGAYSRAGTAFVGFSKQTGRNFPPRLLPFQFSANQGLVLEFGNLYMRVIQNGAYVLEPALSVTNITQANPGVVTSSPAQSDGAAGDWFYITGVSGMTQVNGQTYVASSVSGTQIALSDVYGNNINTATFGAYAGGGTIARVYTLATPWAEADLAWLKFTESADVVSICCRNQTTGTEYPPYDLSRLLNNFWVLNKLSTAPTILPPASVTASATVPYTPPALPTDYQYVITAVGADGAESTFSTVGDATNSVNIASTLGSINISWTAVTTGGGSPQNAAYYNIYKAPPAFGGAGVPPGSLYGFAGISYGTTFVDTNVTPDFNQVPPFLKNPFAAGAILGVNVTFPGSGITTCIVNFPPPGVGGTQATGNAVVIGGAVTTIVMTNVGAGYNIFSPPPTFSVNGGATPPSGTNILGPTSGTYPSVVAYFQQRRVYASSANQPDTYWMSQPGLFHNFDTRVPTIDSDAITGTPWTQQVDGIQFMLPMPGGLVTFTGSSIWQVNGAGSSGIQAQPITPASQDATPQGYIGSSPTVPPIKITYDIIYVQTNGSTVRQLAYNYWVNIYTPVDMTYLSSHLFQGYMIREWGWASEPFKVLWAVRNDGILLSLTYLKEQDVMGWARHDTQGEFRSVTVVDELPNDAPYFAVERQTVASIAAGKVAYFIERMDNRNWPTVENCWCVDCGLALPQSTPNATLGASSATGLGAISGTTGLVGGQNYNAATTSITVSDPTGSGAVLTPTVSGGAVTGVVVNTAGTNYSNPILQIVDSSNQGSGASVSATLNNSATFFTNAFGIFNGGMVGWVIRMGGGIAVITAVNTSANVTANIIQPIGQVVRETSAFQAQPINAPPGQWTLTQPVTTVTGLNHLAGAFVTGLADGKVIPVTQVSATGTVTLSQPASAVVIGLAFLPQMQTLYLDAGQPTVQGRRKEINAITVRMEASTGMSIGINQPDGSTQSPPQIAPQWSNMQLVAPIAPLGQPVFGSNVTPLFTGDARVVPQGRLATTGQIALQQTNPFPMNVIALIPEGLQGDDPSNALPKRQDDAPPAGYLARRQA